jgi:hypothetical protein
LARLQLAARRLGLSIRLQQPSKELCQLLDFVGLAALGRQGGSGLRLERGREAEGCKQLRVEKVVEPRDPPT